MLSRKRQILDVVLFETETDGHESIRLEECYVVVLALLLWKPFFPRLSVFGKAKHSHRTTCSVSSIAGLYFDSCCLE